MDYLSDLTRLGELFIPTIRNAKHETIRKSYLAEKEYSDICEKLSRDLMTQDQFAASLNMMKEDMKKDNVLTIESKSSEHDMEYQNYWARLGNFLIQRKEIQT